MKIAWIDIETTGLDVTKDKICEVACIVTDGRGGRTDAPLFHHIMPLSRRNARRLMNDYVWDMHTESGLLEEMEYYSQIGSDWCWGDTAEPFEKFLRKHAEGAYLGGASVHFDRMFLSRPEWAWAGDPMSILSHRHVDITTLDVTTRATGWGSIQDDVVAPYRHRAYDDVLWSIAVYQEFLQRHLL